MPWQPGGNADCGLNLPLEDWWDADGLFGRPAQTCSLGPAGELLGLVLAHLGAGCGCGDAWWLLPGGLSGTYMNHPSPPNLLKSPAPNLWCHCTPVITHQLREQPCDREGSSVMGLRGMSRPRVIFYSLSMSAVELWVCLLGGSPLSDTSPGSMLDCRFCFLSVCLAGGEGVNTRYCLLSGNRAGERWNGSSVLINLRAASKIKMVDS